MERGKNSVKILELISNKTQIDRPQILFFKTFSKRPVMY